MVEQTEVQRFAADARMKVERATEDEDFVLKQKKARLEDALGPLDMGNDNKEMYGSCADVEMQAAPPSSLHLPQTAALPSARPSKNRQQPGSPGQHSSTRTENSSLNQRTSLPQDHPRRNALNTMC
jgi:hypothetical protein